MTHPSTLALIAAALIATGGRAVAGQVWGHPRLHARVAAAPRAALRFGAVKVRQRIWTGPDRPSVSHDERPGVLLGKYAEPDRPSA